MSVLKNIISDFLKNKNVPEYTIREIISPADDSKKSDSESLIGRIVDAGISSEREVLMHLSRVFGYPYIENIGEDEIDTEILKKIPLSYLKNMNAVPLKSENGNIRIALADPFQINVIDDLSLFLETPSVPVFSPRASIIEAINKFYSRDSANTEEMIKELDTDYDSDVLASLSSLSEEPRDLLDVANEAPIIKFVNTILFQAVKERASDIHIEPFDKELRVRYRIDGILYNTLSLPRKYHAAVISRIKIMADLDIAEKRLPQDGRIKIKIAEHFIDLRVSVIPTSFGERVVMRLLDRTSVLIDMDDLGLDAENYQILNDFINRPNGIILVTGPTGSGKTTTLYSALTRVNTPEKNIITIEDPVEYQLFGIGQIQVNPKIDLTFASGLRSILRQDPDIVMVGEIRDVETAEISIHASLTGHLVLSTLHTNDSAGAVTRLLDMGIEPFLIASSLCGVIAQRLVRVLCPDCKEEYEPDDDELNNIGLSRSMLKNGKIYRGKGCPSCLNMGYKGRIGIFEIMKIDDSIKKLILERADSTTIRNEAIRKGMKLLKDDGIKKVIDGITTIEEVLRVSREG
ncbi:MAG: type II secretion system protein GspE [Candidatus Schekmanbacteria bacterium]|nr:MAG: type II secretion system protein GspE [Candidatus Schekmanbacteria bacterium]